MSPAPSSFEHDSPRVCFVQPHQDINIHPVPRKKTAVLGRYLSLGIATMAACLRREGFPNVSVIDSASPRMSYEQFEQRIRDIRPHIAALTATTMDWPEVGFTSQAPRMKSGFTITTSTPGQVAPSCSLCSLVS